MSQDRDIRELFRRAADAFGAQVHTVGDDQWQRPTPCSDWDVRALANHLVGEMRWAPLLLAGQTTAEVGDRFDGDQLGDDPEAAWDDSARDAVAAVVAAGAMERIVHLSFGDVPGAEYTHQLFADLLVHGWDLARAIGADDRLDPELVDACTAWFAAVEDAYRSAGAIGPRVEVTTGADPQTRLLAAFGRSR